MNSALIDLHHKKMGIDYLAVKKKWYHRNCSLMGGSGNLCYKRKYRPRKTNDTCSSSYVSSRFKYYFVCLTWNTCGIYEIRNGPQWETCFRKGEEYR